MNELAVLVWYKTFIRTYIQRKARRCSGKTEVDNVLNPGTKQGDVRRQGHLTEARRYPHVLKTRFMHPQ
jgi:hypothetical protein